MSGTVGGYRPGSGRKPGNPPYDEKASKAAYYEANKEQLRKYCKEYNRTHGDEARNRRLKKNYGITLRQYDEMLAKQDFACAICGTDNPHTDSKVFCVDHDHSTGAVRGLLCVHCNKGLGCFHDNIERLDRAGDYLGR